MEDIISRAEAVRALCANCKMKELCSIEEDYRCDDANMLLNMPAVEMGCSIQDLDGEPTKVFVVKEMAWRPAAAPPEEGERVLCQTRTKKGVVNMVIGYYMDGRWCCGMNSNVEAWAPLPEPYDPEE